MTRSQLHLGQIVTELSRARAAAHVVTGAQLTAGVVAPALHGVIVQQHTGVEGPGRDRDRSAARAECDGWETVTHLTG